MASICSQKNIYSGNRDDTVRAPVESRNFLKVLFKKGKEGIAAIRHSRKVHEFYGLPAFMLFPQTAL
jgi:hypothetical protein